MFKPVLVDQQAFALAAAAAAAAAVALGATPQQTARAVLVALEAVPAACALASGPNHFHIAEDDLDDGRVDGGASAPDGELASGPNHFQIAEDDLDDGRVDGVDGGASAPDGEVDTQVTQVFGEVAAPFAIEELSPQAFSVAGTGDAGNFSHGDSSVEDGSPAATGGAGFARLPLGECKDKVGEDGFGKCRLLAAAVDQPAHTQSSADFVGPGSSAPHGPVDTMESPEVFEVDGVDLLSFYREVVEFYGPDSTCADELAKQIELHRCKDG